MRADEILREAEVLVGYHTYLDLVRDYFPGKVEIHSSGMKREVERARLAVSLARQGYRVAVISGGDPGVYGMAGPVLELAGAGEEPVEVEVVPGITAATAAASTLGAPLMNDFAVISLSDLLTPREVIERRLEAAARGDFVVVLYNPASRRRVDLLPRARDILLCHRGADTPAGLVRSCKRGEEQVVITSLEKLGEEKVDMLTTVIVGNSQTVVVNGRMVTRRGYAI